MKAVVLAAGRGMRMRPVSKHLPKCLLPVKHKRILDYQLEPLRALDIRSVVIVTGHCSEKVKSAYPGYHFIYNPDYASTNSLYSLWLTKDLVYGQPFILFNSDIIAHPELIVRLIFNPHPSAALIDDRKSLRDGEMNAVIVGGKISRFSRRVSAKDAHAESIQITKFGARDSILLFDRIQDLVNEGRTNLFPAAAYDAVMKHSTLYPVFADGLPYYEIDTPKHLQHCRETIDF